LGKEREGWVGLERFGCQATSQTSLSIHSHRYSVGTEISPGDLELHRAMAEWNESPIYMLLVRDSIWLGWMGPGHIQS
jgi:hypothetical protein